MSQDGSHPLIHTSRSTRTQLPRGCSEYQALMEMVGKVENISSVSMVLFKEFEPQLLTHESGLLDRVAPQLMNLLARGQVWDHVLSVGSALSPSIGLTCVEIGNVGMHDDAQSCGDGLEEEGLSDADTEFWEVVENSHHDLWECALTPKVLLTGMIASFPLQERMRLAAWAHAMYPLPFVFRHPEEEGRLVVDALHLQHMLSGTFLASIPFETSGNSSLLRHLFRRAFQLSPSRVSPLHAGSVDISLTKKDQSEEFPIEPFHILDFHVGQGDNAASTEEQAAVRACLGFAQYFLIHFPMRINSFKETKEVLLQRVKPFLRSCCKRDAEQNSSSKRVFLLARDVDPSDKCLERNFKQLSSEFKKWEKELLGTPITFELVPVLSTMQEIPMKEVLLKVYNKLREHLQGASAYETFWNFHDAVCQARNEVPEGAPLLCSPWCRQTDAYASRDCHDVVAGALHEVGNGWGEALRYCSSPFVKEVDEVCLGKLKGTLADIINRRTTMRYPSLLDIFARTLKDQITNLMEWKRQLAAITEMHAPEMKRLVDEFRSNKEIHDQSNQRIAEEITVYGEVKTGGLEAKRDTARNECELLDGQISQLRITSEKLWREMVEFYDCFEYMDESYRRDIGFSQTALVDSFVKAMHCGFAMELLDGDKIAVHPQFLAAVFKKLGESTENEGCRTISILGPQSSGKSTLANALWGGDFATSAGRCTKGLYASMFQTDYLGLGSLLFLDTEGLCSVENDSEFDQKLALLTIAMSDVVLINVRGEIDKKVSDVLQIAVFCLEKMSILSGERKPELIFVQRDMVDFDKSKSDETMHKVQESLKDAAALLQNPGVTLQDILDFNKESLFLMPCAFKPVEKVLYSHSAKVQAPNPDFGESCFKLRRKIMELAKRGHCNVSSMKEWGERFCSVKKTIDKFNDMAKFKDLLALQTEQALEEQLRKLLDRFVDGEETRDEQGRDDYGSSLAVTLTKKQSEMETAIADIQKSLGNGADPDLALDSITRSFSDFCSKEVSRLVGQNGCLVQAFQSFCKTNQSITMTMRKDGERMLRRRVEMFVQSRQAAFMSLQQRHRADSLQMTIYEGLREKLGQLRRTIQRTDRKEAEALFDKTWEPFEKKLTTMLDANKPDYKSQVQKTVESFVNAEKFCAVNLHTITNNTPDEKFRAMQFGAERGQAPIVIGSAASIARQFDHCFFLRAASVDPRRRVARRGVLEGLWTSKRKDRLDHFLFYRDGDSMVCDFRYLGSPARGVMQEDPSNGHVFCDLIAVEDGQRLLCRFEFGAIEDASFQYMRKINDGRPRQWLSAEKVSIKTDGLSNICQFFDVPEPQHATASFNFKDIRTWVNVFNCTDVSATVDALQVEAKSGVVKSAYEWISDTIAKFVGKVATDKEMSNLAVLLKELLQELRAPRSSTSDVSMPSLWEFRAEMVNECLRVFCHWVRQHAENARSRSDETTVDKFKMSMENTRRIFINAVTMVQDDQTAASAFLAEFWEFTNRKTRQEVASSVRRKVSCHYPSPEKALEAIDKLYIGTEGRSAAELFHYITEPAKEMRRFLKQVCDEVTTKATNEAQVQWVNKLTSIRDNFVSLCHSLRNNMPSLDPIEDASDPEITFNSFMRFLNEGSAQFSFGGTQQTLTTDVRVYGADHNTMKLSITTVHKIHRLDTFMSALLAGLGTWKPTETLMMDDRDQVQTSVVEQWVGCNAQCPYCKKKCTLSQHGSDTKHQCKFHQPVGFGGVTLEGKKQPLFIFCDEFDNQGRHYIVKSTGRKLEFQAHLKQEHNDWNITLGESGMAEGMKMQAGYSRVWGIPQVRRNVCRRYDMVDTTWEEGLRLARLPVRHPARIAQVALVLDTTSSMRSEIEQCKRDCCALVDDIKKNVDQVEFAFCGYKDIGDEGHLQSVDFSKNPLAVKRLISTQAATGGGDTPEDMLGAFEIVNKFAWAPVSDAAVLRIMILIADAPCHGRAYHDFGPDDDHHAQDGLLMPNALEALISKGVGCLFAAIRPCTLKMQQAFRKHWEEHGDTCCRFQEFSARRDMGGQVLLQARDQIQALIQS